MSKISELSDGGSLISSDYLIAVRSGGNVKVRMDQINVDQVDLGDNEFIRLGNSQDLTMVHTSTQSIINQAGIGDLLIQRAGATKLTINASGIDVTGSVTADGLTVANTSVVAGDFDGGTAATYIRLQDDTDNFLFGSNNSLGNFLIKNETADALRLSVANTGDISFYEDTGATPKFVWDASAESLGIGTSSPSGRVTIQSQGASTYPLWIKHSDGSNAFLIYEHGSGELEIDLRKADGSSPKFKIDEVGNVGIGTGSPDAQGGNQSTILNLEGSDNLVYFSGGSGGNAIDDGLAIEGVATGVSSGDKRTGSILMTRANTSTTSLDSKIAFYTTASGTHAERLRIDASGNVGIGASAGERLTVSVTNPTDGLVASLRNIGTSGLTGTKLWFNQNTVDNWNIGQPAGVNAFVFCNSTGSTLERMRLDASGNLLVGKNVAGTAQGFEVHQNGEVYSNIVNGLNTYHVYANAAYRFYVKPDGGIVNYSSNNINLSDEREKKNVEALPSQWDCLKHWDLKQFHYNADDDALPKKYGVIAQEIEAHCPEVIDVFKVDEDTERMGVKEQQIMWMAVKALQEAQTRIESLEARIAALES